jgi:hypothetical protein
VQDTFTSTLGALERLTQLFIDAVQFVSVSDRYNSCIVFCTNSVAQEVSEIRCLGTRPFVIPILLRVFQPFVTGSDESGPWLGGASHSAVKLCPSFTFSGHLFRSFNAFCASFFVLFIINRRVCYAVWRYFVFLLLIFFKFLETNRPYHTHHGLRCAWRCCWSQWIAIIQTGWSFDVWYQSDICRSFGSAVSATVSLAFLRPRYVTYTHPAPPSIRFWAVCCRRLNMRYLAIWGSAGGDWRRAGCLCYVHTDCNDRCNALPEGGSIMSLWNVIYLSN